MADDQTRYQTHSVRAIRGMEDRTITKWERDGWELVSQEPGKLHTQINLRRPKKKMPAKALLIGAGAVVALLAVIITIGVVSEMNSVAPESTATPEAVNTNPSESAAPTEPEAEATQVSLTVVNSDEFAALVTLSDYCDPSIAAFAEAHAGDSIEFDGYISAMSSHDGASTRYDILIGAGDFTETSALGPAFQFRDVNTTYDLHYAGDTPDAIGVGQNLHITAEVGDYESGTCLLMLEPVTTSFR